LDVGLIFETPESPRSIRRWRGWPTLKAKGFPGTSETTSDSGERIRGLPCERGRMSYVVSGLLLDPFQPLFGLPDEALAERAVVRITADDHGFYPCRVLLEDAKPGESLLLLNYEHQPARTPYRSRHAIFVSESARETRRLVDRMPDILSTRRLISLRAYDEVGMMIDADVVPGAEVEATVLHMFTNGQVGYIHAHNAARGCYAALIERLA
jgi:hypothetical protein